MHFIFLIIALVSSSENWNLSTIHIDPQKIETLQILGQFLLFENQFNFTKKELKANTEFAKELWINTEYTTDEIYEETPSELFDPFDPSDVIPTKQESIVATQAYLNQWQAQNDSDKSVILQYIIEEMLINEYYEEGEEEESELASYDFESLVHEVSDQQEILENNQKNKGTDYYIEPLKWIHTNITDDEILLATVFYDLQKNNITFENYLEQQTPAEKQALLTSFFKYFANVTQNQTQNTTGTEPQVLPQTEKRTPPTISAESPIYMYIVTIMMITLLLIIAVLFRRYMIRKRLLNFQMNEEQNVQGFQS